MRMKTEKMSRELSFSAKLKKLFAGRRPFGRRLLLALFPALSLSFTLFFFGPLDLSCISRSYISWSPLSILPITAAVMGAVFAVLLLAAAVPGGHIHAFLVSVYTGLSAAFYLQGALLNSNLGTMDGHTVNWPSFSTKMLLNLAVWCVILLVPHLIHYFNNRVWRGAVMLVCSALVLMQGVSLGVKLADQAAYDRSRPESYYISNENILNVGTKNNVAVFLLDTVSDKDITAMLEKYPDSLNLFHDFVRYENANSHYMFTVPSLVNLLTGREWDCEHETVADYMEQAWKSERAAAFYRELADRGYVRNIYMLLPEAASDPSVLLDAFSTLKLANKDTKIDRSAFVKLIKLSFYRYFPMMMKPFFVIYTSDISNLVTRNDAMTSEWDFVTRMNEAPLAAGSYENAFFFYYLQGSHLPYRLDDRGRMINSNLAPEYFTNYSEKEDQLAGFFYLIGDYIRQLKEMGLYDQTGIIILADHGNNQDRDADHQPIYLVKMPGEKRDAIEIRSAPVTIQDSFQADVMAMVGNTGFEWGIPSAQVPDEPAERWTRVYAKDEDYPLLRNKYYNVMREYRYTGDGDWLIERWREGVFETVPMIDSYY